MPKLKSIYILESKEEVDYDEYAGFVVRAENAKEARQLAEDALGRFASEAGRWLDPKRSSCNYITTIGKSQIILSDFRAG